MTGLNVLSVLGCGLYKHADIQWTMNWKSVHSPICKFSVNSEIILRSKQTCWGMVWLHHGMKSLPETLTKQAAERRICRVTGVPLGVMSGRGNPVGLGAAGWGGKTLGTVTAVQFCWRKRNSFTCQPTTKVRDASENTQESSRRQRLSVNHQRDSNCLQKKKKKDHRAFRATLCSRNAEHSRQGQAGTVPTVLCQ